MATGKPIPVPAHVREWLYAYSSGDLQISSESPLHVVRRFIANKAPVRCPCCRHHVQAYKRSLNLGMATALIKCYPWFMANPGIYLNMYDHIITKLNIKPGEFSKLVNWGILARQPGERDDGCKNSGKYILTDTGRLFVLNRVTVPDHYWTYNKQILPWELDAPRVSIADVINAKKGFNYDELMRESGYGC